MQTIHLACFSGNKNTIDEILSYFPSESYQFDFFDQVGKFGLILEEKDYDLILLDDQTFPLEAEKAFLKKILQTENVVLFRIGGKSGGKMVFLKNGGWMIAEGEFWKERLQFYLQQIPFLESHLKPAIYSRNVMVSSLNQQPLREILFNTFLEKKSIELFVLGEVKNGRIVIQDGEVILAEFGSSDDVESLIRLLMLRKGIVRIIPYNGKSNSFKILPSIPAFNAESAFQEKLFLEWLQGFTPQASLYTSLVWKDSSIPMFTSHNEKKLAFFLKEPREISQLIEFMDTMPLQLLEMVMHMWNAGSLEIVQEKAEQREVASVSPDERIQWLKELLQLPAEAQLARLMIFGLPASGKNEFIAMLRGKGAEVRKVHRLDFSRVPIGSGFELHLFGLEIEDSSLQYIQTFGQKMHGYIFMIDATRTDRFEYTNYLINVFLNSFRVPSLVVLSNTQYLASDAVEQIMKKFTFVREVPFIHLDITQLADPWTVVKYLSLNHQDETDGSQKE